MCSGVLWVLRLHLAYGHKAASRFSNVAVDFEANESLNDWATSSSLANVPAALSRDDPSCVAGGSMSISDLNFCKHLRLTMSSSLDSEANFKRLTMNSGGDVATPVVEAEGASTVTPITASAIPHLWYLGGWRNGASKTLATGDVSHGCFGRNCCRARPRCGNQNCDSGSGWKWWRSQSRTNLFPRGSVSTALRPTSPGGLITMPLSLCWTEGSSCDKWDPSPWFPLLLTCCHDSRSSSSRLSPKMSSSKSDSLPNTSSRVGESSAINATANDHDTCGGNDQAPICSNEHHKRRSSHCTRNQPCQECAEAWQELPRAQQQVHEIAGAYKWEWWWFHQESPKDESWTRNLSYPCPWSHSNFCRESRLTQP